MVRLSARALVAAIPLLAAPAAVLPAHNAAWAQQTDASKTAPTEGGTTSTEKKVSKKSKPAPKYEEYYEMVPADDDDPSGTAPVQGSGLDPEADTSPPPANTRTLGTHKGTTPAQAAPQPVQGKASAPDDTAKDNNAAVQSATPNESEKRTESGAGHKPPTATATAAAPLPGTEGGLGEDVTDLAYFRHVVDNGGEWQTHARYGDVFVPKVPADWRPYTVGHWVYSDAYGWTWISDEPFGWATYHYGRWTRDDSQGWMWIPDGDWGPSWVVWRQTDDAIGWAALPPSAKFTGGRLSLDANAIDNASFEQSWVFIRPRYFARAQMSRYLRPAHWNKDLVDRSQARLGYGRDAQTGQILNRGIPPEEVEKLAGEPVARTTVSTVDDPRVIASKGLAGRKGEVTIFRPTPKRVEQALKANPTRSKRTGGDSSTSSRARAGQAGASNAPKSFAAPPPTRAEQAGTQQTEQTAEPKARGTQEGPKTEAATQQNAGATAATGANAATTSATGSVSAPAGKRSWDSSGPSGAPNPPAASASGGQ
ncbi:MAG: hypothetical protein JNL45_16075 [Hyphomicrobium sp.]|nr:hypothetical protein [Hyphomicrobium sp.]